MQNTLSINLMAFAICEWNVQYMPESLATCPFPDLPNLIAIIVDILAVRINSV
jgi:hypothetical protein